MPRSGIGLNELLAPPRKTKRDGATSADRSTAELRLALDERTRADNERGSAIWPEVTPNQELLCRAKHFWAELPPELSRTVLRPRRRDNVPCGAVAAKRSRLERIVSAESGRKYLPARPLRI